MDARDVVRRSFGTVRRGFDPQEVRAYLELLANSLEHAERREQELVQDLQEAEDRARHPVIDESVLTSSLGQRSAAVLRGAHEEAARILSQAEEAAATMVREAQQQATDVQVNGESSAAERIAQAELEANSLRQQARDESAVALEAAREEGEAVVERAREHGRTMLDQAQEARRRVLADMAHRRRLVTEQIELLRSARDEIAGSVVGVRRSLDKIVDDLSRAEDSARGAATAAARPHSVDVPEPVLVEEGERAVTELGEIGGGPDETQKQESRTLLRFDDIATKVEQPARSSPDGGAPASNGSDEGTPDESAARSPAPDTNAGGAEASGAAVRDLHDDPSAVATAAHAPVPTPDQLVPEGPDAADPAVGGRDVDGLFARLRARHRTDAEDAASAIDVPASAPGEVASPAEQPTADTPRGSGAVTGAVTKSAVTDGAVTGGAVTESDLGVDEIASEDEGSPDAQAFARRSDLLDPIVTNLARRLKRALQDDQNRLLDRLRQGTGEWSDGLLPDEASQQFLYADAAATSLRDAMSSGTLFARATLGGRQAKVAADDRAVEAVSGELASTVVTLIRRRLEGGEIPDAGERIGAAYREWRGERIERLAEDSAVEAFSKGVVVGAGRRTVRWSRSEAGPGCADCEDNALAGPVLAGKEFPTGHRHPPAHAGCRCLVLPTPI
jgi:DivIVA domain-containing protein